MMHFWRTYPQVALAGLPDCPLTDGVRPPADEAVRLVGDVFLGWLRRYAPAELDTDDSIWSRHTDSFTRPYLGHGRFTFAEEVHFTNEVHQYIVWAERSGDGLDPAKYTPSQHPDDVRHHAAGLLDFYFEKG
ncbi:hypothetical protein E4P41_13855 [Geodermatophilus sp. DF01-2]|nr:hypothetical protein E4P41_13855 [Geodermatophilus sp. DF01_2]